MLNKSYCFSAFIEGPIFYFVYFLTKSGVKKQNPPFKVRITEFNQETWQSSKQSPLLLCLFSSILGQTAEEILVSDLLCDFLCGVVHT